MNPRLAQNMQRFEAPQCQVVSLDDRTRRMIYFKSFGGRDTLQWRAIGDRTNLILICQRRVDSQVVQRWVIKHGYVRMYWCTTERL